VSPLNHKNTAVGIPLIGPDPNATRLSVRKVFSKIVRCTKNNLANNKHSYYVDGMSDDLGFLLGDAARLLRRSFDERARAMGVTRPQWRVLALLKRFDGSTQVTVADMLDVEPITLGRMVDRMQDAGMVERRADPADRRRWRLHLTAEGEQKIEALRPTALALYDDAMAGLDEAQRLELEAMLNIVRANLTRKPLEVSHG
jgi:DNA-binding MarR family transcriptional regulator